MFALPTDILTVIKEFSGPIMTRADWRTCKQREAELVKEGNELINFYLEETRAAWSWSEETEDAYTWSFYGKRWLLNAPQWQCISERRPPRIPPGDWPYPDPKDWYSHQIQWLNQ
jgi:hypothetical protein